MNAQRKHEEAAQQPAAVQQYAPEIEAALDRMAVELRRLCRAPQARNDADYSQSSMLGALESRRSGADNLGRKWSDPVVAHYGVRLARLKNQLSGITGLTELMFADFQSRQDSDAEEQLGAHLREQLFLALVELTAEANHNMEFIGDCVEDAVRHRVPGQPA